MKTKRTATVFLLALLGAAWAPGCGQIEVGTVGGATGAIGGQPDGAEAGAGANSEPQGGVSGILPSGGAPGQASAGAADPGSAGVAGADGASCAPPGEEPWPGCFADQPCSVCASAIKNYPLYLLRHPLCESFYACDHGGQSACSSDCPKPGAADQCDGTVGNWRGCRGLGCYVCTELVADYPNYFVNHPFCLSNPTCEGSYFTCSAACPGPTEADR